MPSDLSYWVVSAPLKDGDPDIMLDEVRRAVGGDSVIGAFEIPELKVGVVLWSYSSRCQGGASWGHTWTYSDAYQS